jgi:hypothetical protein
VTTTVSPDPVVAGEPFTVDVTATDQVSVTGIAIVIDPPVGLPNSTVKWAATCEGGEFTPEAASARSFTCTVPDQAPNGTWLLTATAASGAAPGFSGRTNSTFEVTGGSDDHAAPALVGIEISPNPVIIGEPFSVTIRASDEHHRAPAPASLGANIVIPAPPEGTVNWTCSPATPTWFADTVLEWRFTDCMIPAGSSPWTYAGGLRVEDALGYYQRHSFSFQAVAG